MTTTEHASATSPGDTPAPPGAAVDLDISARSFWAKPYEEREKTFAWLRANEPVSYHRPYESTLVPPEPDSPGFWALTKHEDCGGKLTKVLSPAGIVLKGSGFYKTDNRSSSKRGGQEKSTETSGTKETSSSTSSSSSDSSSGSGSSSTGSSSSGEAKSA